MIIYKRKYLVYARNYAPAKLQYTFKRNGIEYVRVRWENYKRKKGYLEMTFKKDEVVITRLETALGKWLRAFPKNIIRFLFNPLYKRYKNNVTKENNSIN